MLNQTMKDLDIEYVYSVLQLSKNTWAVIQTADEFENTGSYWTIHSKHPGYTQALITKNNLKQAQKPKV